MIENIIFKQSSNVVSSKIKTGTAVYICCKEDVPGKGYDIFKIQGQM